MVLAHYAEPQGGKACASRVKDERREFFVFSFWAFSEIREIREFSDAPIPKFIKFPMLPMSWV